MNTSKLVFLVSFISLALQGSQSNSSQQSNFDFNAQRNRAYNINLSDEDKQQAANVLYLGALKGSKSAMRSHLSEQNNRSFMKKLGDYASDRGAEFVIDLPFAIATTVATTIVQHKVNKWLNPVEDAITKESAKEMILATQGRELDKQRARLLQTLQFVTTDEEKIEILAAIKDLNKMVIAHNEKLKALHQKGEWNPGMPINVAELLKKNPESAPEAKKTTPETPTKPQGSEKAQENSAQPVAQPA